MLTNMTKHSYDRVSTLILALDELHQPLCKLSAAQLERHVDCPRIGNLSSCPQWMNKLDFQ